MVAKDENNNSIKIPGLLLKDTTEIQCYLKAIKRREMKKIAKVNLIEKILHQMIT